MNREAATVRALWRALLANISSPLDVADRLTRRALWMAGKVGA